MCSSDLVIRGKLYKEHMNKLIKSSEYRNNRLPYGPPGDESLQTTRGDILQSMMMQLNTMARLTFEKEFRDKINLVKLAQDIRDRRSTAGVKAFVPPGIDRQLEDINRAEAEDTERRRALAREIKTGVRFE